MSQNDGILSYTYEIKHNYVVKIEIRTCGKKKARIMRVKTDSIETVHEFDFWSQN